MTMAMMMSDRWYSLTIASSRLESLRTALAMVGVHQEGGAIPKAACETAQQLLRQVERHIHNEKTIITWEKDFDE
jgi:hypothetical protein